MCHRITQTKDDLLRSSLGFCVGDAVSNRVIQFNGTMKTLCNVEKMLKGGSGKFY
jgi:hypothetical protein